MTNTEPQRCLDCGVDVPGGGFCRRCLADRIHDLSEAYEMVQRTAESTHRKEADVDR